MGCNTTALQPLVKGKKYKSYARGIYATNQGFSEVCFNQERVCLEPEEVALHSLIETRLAYCLPGHNHTNALGLSTQYLYASWYLTRCSPEL